jgi:hypothetical protein
MRPRPGIYLRQVDLPGVDSKFIEANRGVLGELLDLALPVEALDTSATGASQFCQRYGFRDKPLRIRFRILDASVALLAHGLLPAVGDQDIALTQADFAELKLPVSRVFFTENEVNFLAFPPLAGSMVVFGAGYGFEVLAGAHWLQERSVYYWGDIDTHGFAILDQLRAQLPQVQSLLMDRATLLAHKSQWGNEPQPVLRDLRRLDAAESALFDDLRAQRLRDNTRGVKPPTASVRLEQERIGFAWLEHALAALVPRPSTEPMFAPEFEGKK